MSDSESDYQQLAPIAKPSSKSPSRKTAADGKVKRKANSNKLTSQTSKKSKNVLDVFGISRNTSNDAELRTISSYFVNRVGSGSERRTADIDGSYLADVKVYKTEDACDTDSKELWKKALVRIKLQTDTGSPQWRKLQEFVTSADELFEEEPKFYT